MTFFPKILDPVREECGLDTGATIYDAIVISVQSGATHEIAATWAGVHPTTLSRWIRRGSEEIARMAKNNLEHPETTEEPYAKLVIDLMTADADAQMRLIAHWDEHFGRDWRAVEKFMQRRWPKVWGDQPRRLELTGPGGGPVGIAAAVMSPDEAEAMLAAIEAREAQDNDPALNGNGQHALPEAAAG